MITSKVTATMPATGYGRRQALARLCHGAQVTAPLARLRTLLRDDLRILAYHRVLESADPAGFDFDVDLISASAERFYDQMAFLRRRFHPMRFDEVLERVEAGRPLPSRAVLVSFDDGYDDNHRVAFPILNDLGMSAMFFVSTGHVDSGLPFSYDWLVHMVCSIPAGRLSVPELALETPLPEGLDGRRQLVRKLLTRLKSLDDASQTALIARLEREWGIARTDGHPDCRPMNWDQLREMRDGGMEVGSHGVTHRMLAKLSIDDLVQELQGSKATLDRELGTSVEVLAYPVGGPDAFDAKVIETAREAGYRMACSYISGTNPVVRESRYALNRLPVERDMDAAWFESMVSLPEVFGFPSRRRAY
ncbi:polysaccharide deacetylase family protein [Lysobacter sp. A286]